MSKAPLFISGIGTNVGKTIVSAVLTEQLRADYWKPVQSGDLEYTDSDKVRELISNQHTVIHPETFRLKQAASPHQSAKEEGIEIRPEDFILPKTDNRLIIEGAGGLLVPLSNNFFITDLIKHLNVEIVLVARNYLGCINHTLMSFQLLSSLGLPLKHLVLNGTFPADSTTVLLNHLPAGCSWSYLPEFTSLNKTNIAAAPIQIT